MDYEEEIAREILNAAHERLEAGEKHPRPFIQPMSTCHGSSDRFYRDMLAGVTRDFMRERRRRNRLAAIVSIGSGAIVLVLFTLVLAGAI